MDEQADVVVLGMGVGGESVAGSLAESGLDVIGIENRLVGGECPYWGCIPSKMIIRAADLLAEARRVDGMAGHAEATPDWTPVAKRIRDEATTDWDDRIAAERFTGKGGRLVRGRGRLTGPGRVEVDGTTYEARRAVVVGTGTTPVIPPIDGLSDTPYWTNHEALEADQLPESLIVLGGGAVGLELAQGFARFGTRVTVIEAQDRMLPGEEPESSQIVERALKADGIDIHTDSRAGSVSHDGSVFTVTLSDGTSVRGTRLLVSVGRRAQLSELGVDTVGLDPSAAWLQVDDRLRAADGVYGVGDVTGHGAFTHMATYQADIVVREILGQDGPPADYRAVPRVTFTDPEIGTVGMTEAQARDAGRAVRVGVAQVPSTARGWIHKAGNDGVIKLVADADEGVLIGATSAGPTGGEVLGALSVSVHGRVPVETLRHMIYAYPTIHRGIQDALRALG
ncbi:pyruvate/2-oxoglutarate dehydrogenase complex dihydrolipoamide dehydrogenase (E3) component [Haloactinopolyspora alba]|uniref:Pyruvate/2-oxoglutarate dehydrogenase complex dihydrolipoamide dehydrogenase (E3) component n=2 Tax=Haloactinopolyspora alba TaxID=648780 RepID=A0A2P8DLZ9_9ACTN|nr:NAD(P)/FAD-dependent oxidoreductase [Haloactinopolyspora alba]PSK98225.1 pyruvate/2-oxoglutarate dehydrogenase complex dihydrolipoamide dehydrogenase (E3) component [Haloactinopolyspora alba]